MYYVAEHRIKYIHKIFIFLLLTTVLFSENRTIPLHKLFKTELKIKDKIFYVWLALSPKQQSEGLSFVEIDEVSNKEGMLFIYPLNAQRTFWMNNTFIDLDIIFIKEDGTIDQLYSMSKDSTQYYGSMGMVRYVLELRKGILETIPLHIGDKIEISKEISDFSQP